MGNILVKNEHDLNGGIWTTAETERPRIDANSDAFLDMDEQTIKMLNNDEIEVVTKLFELDIDLQTKAVQGIIDYMATIVQKSTAIMSNLDFAKLNGAIATYEKTHKKEAEQKPELKV